MANFLSNLSPDWFNSVMGNPGAAPQPLDAAPVPQQPGITTLPDVPNMLQNLNVQPGVSANAASVPDQPEAPRARRSILDTIGRLADVFAKVGGADALYQPTLDAREDRSLALGDRARMVDLDKIKLATARNTLDDAGRARLAQAVRGTQALLAANPQADISKVFPLLAQRAGVDPQQATALAGELTSNPGLLDGLAGFDDNGDKYGGSVVYAKGPDGKIVAFQPNLKGGKGRQVLPDGFEAVDPLKFVNLGDRQVGVGGRSGEVVTTLANGINPDKAADRSSREGIADKKNSTAITVAGMPARAKPAGAGDGKKGDPAGALAILDNIQSSFDNLHKLQALPGEGGAVGNIIGSLGRTTLGQSIGARTGYSAAAQERELLGKNLGSLQSEMIKSLPGAATRTKFEQEIQRKRLPDPTTMNYSTARSAIAQIRAEYQRALQPGYAADSGGARKLPPRIGASAPRRPAAGKPTVSNW
jgi:hypothetical protein